MNQPDFYLRFDDSPEETRVFACKAGLRVRNRSRDDLLVITADPPLPIGPEGVSESTAILATRYQGSTLFPPQRWPIYVYVIAVQSGVDLSTHRVLQPSEYLIAVWGALYPTWEQAILSINAD